MALSPLTRRWPARRVLSAAVAAAAVAAAARPPPGLFGLSATAQLLRIADNGTTTAVGAALGGQPAQGLAVIDAASAELLAVLFQGGRATLVTADLATGKQVAAVPLPFAEQAFVGVGQYIALNSLTGLVIVGGQLRNETHVLGQVDRRTGAYTEFARFSSCDYADAAGTAQAAFVPALNTVLVQAARAIPNPPPFPLPGTTILAIELDTGAVRALDEGLDSGRNIMGAVFDPPTGSVFGIGTRANASSPVGFDRVLSRLFPQNLTIADVGRIETREVTDLGGMTAVDSAGRALYMLADNGATKDKFELIRVDLETAAVDSAAVECDINSCPWALDFLPAAAAPAPPPAAARSREAFDFLFAKGRIWRAESQ